MVPLRAATWPGQGRPDRGSLLLSVADGAEQVGVREYKQVTGPV